MRAARRHGVRAAGLFGGGGNGGGTDTAGGLFGGGIFGAEQAPPSMPPAAAAPPPAPPSLPPAIESLPPLPAEAVQAPAEAVAAAPAAPAVDAAATAAAVAAAPVPLDALPSAADAAAPVAAGAAATAAAAAAPAAPAADSAAATVAAVPAAAADAAASLTAAAASGAVDAAAGAADVPPELIKTSGAGIFTPVANALEAMLKALDGGLEALHVPYSYGFAIIILTVAVKVITLPLTKKQIESSTQLQLLQPRVKELQEEYKNDPETLQVETAKLYKRAQVNPLAGCLPVLVTLPVFIGLYRALSAAANEGLLAEGFFWIPSLSGPTAQAIKTGGGVSWLVPFVDGHPPIGWHDALCYLSLPVTLVASQFVSQQILSAGQSQDPSQKQTQAILKFLPLMLGWFSLTVPSGLSLYWITNNILSVGQTVLLKRGVTLPPELDDDPDFGIGNDGSVAGAPKRVAAVPSAPPLPTRREGVGERFKALKAREGGNSSATSAESAPQTARGQKFASLKADTPSTKPRAEDMSGEVVVAEVTELTGNGNGAREAEAGGTGEPVPASTGKSGSSVLRKKKGGKRSR